MLRWRCIESTGVQAKFQKAGRGPRIRGRPAGSFWNTPPKAGRSDRLRGIATRTRCLWFGRGTASCKLQAAARGIFTIDTHEVDISREHSIHHTMCTAGFCMHVNNRWPDPGALVEHLSTPSRWLVISGSVGPAAFICVVFHCKHCSLAGTAGSLPLGRWQWRWRQPRLDPGTFCFEPPNCLDSLVDSMAWLGGDDQSLRAKLWSEINPNHLSRVSTSEYEYLLGAGISHIRTRDVFCVL